MKKVLIVDNNAETRRTLLSELRTCDELRVLSTDCAKTAVRLFKSQHIDLLITELALPEIDGFKLLSYIKNDRPNIPAIAISNVLSDHMIDHLKSIGVFIYFKKPVNAAALLDTLFELLDIHPQSSIHGITLTSFLQLMSIEQKTCTLSLSARENKGMIQCVNGEIVGAQAGDVIGRAAFRKIMEWENPTIRIKEGCSITERQINAPLMHLLMESQYMIDESEKNKPATGSLPEPENFNHHLEDLNYRELKAKLSRISGVTGYEILNDRGMILNQADSSGRALKISPLDFFSIGNTISSLVGGSLVYLKINQSDRSSYLIGKSNHYFIQARLEPGTEAADIMR